MGNCRQAFDHFRDCDPRRIPQLLADGEDVIVLVEWLKLLPQVRGAGWGGRVGREVEVVGFWAAWVP